MPRMRVLIFYWIYRLPLMNLQNSFMRLPLKRTLFQFAAFYVCRLEQYHICLGTIHIPVTNDCRGVTLPFKLRALTKRIHCGLHFCFTIISCIIRCLSSHYLGATVTAYQLPGAGLSTSAGTGFPKSCAAKKLPFLSSIFSLISDFAIANFYP